jgi:hypothetical protein
LCQLISGLDRAVFVHGVCPLFMFAEKTGFFACYLGFARVVMDKNPVFGLFSVES